MLADAISHAVLPGIVIAYLFSGSREQGFMLLGAALIGVFTTVMIEYLHQKGKLQSDAAIGLTFTFLFAVGVIMISAFANQIDLDQECVLYGEIAYLPLDSWITGSGIDMGPAPLYVLGAVLVINIIILIIGYRYLKLTTFDPRYALAVGVSVPFWNYLLMGAVSITTVASFESVGAILVVAFFVVPPAAAYLLTHSLKRMLSYTILIGVGVSLSGYWMAVWLNVSIAGAMSTMAGVFFMLAFFYSRLVTKVTYKGRFETKSLGN